MKLSDEKKCIQWQVVQFIFRAILLLQNKVFFIFVSWVNPSFIFFSGSVHLPPDINIKYYPVSCCWLLIIIVDTNSKWCLTCGSCITFLVFHFASYSHESYSYGQFKLFPTESNYVSSFTHKCMHMSVYEWVYLSVFLCLYLIISVHMYTCVCVFVSGDLI